MVGLRPWEELLAGEISGVCRRSGDRSDYQLLAFTKGGALVKKTASVAEIIRDSASFTMRGSNVRCDFHIDPGLWPAEVDRSQISQVIQNLVLNADQSMPSGGRMDVSAENVVRETEEDLPRPPGQYIRITVRDQGAGISEADLTRIFDPYFTTKETGSGLGLATAYAIVKNHEGHSRWSPSSDGDTL